MTDLDMKGRRALLRASLLCVPVCAALVCGCLPDDDDDDDGDPKQTIETISPAEAKDLFDNDPGLVIIDVRTAGEYSGGHIAGAVNVDWQSSSPTFEELIDAYAKDGTYLIYCGSGGRSGQALQVMKGLDFLEVYDIEGGLTEWVNAGYPVV
jgi:rhodanese-related sulfurtransferase